MYRLANEVQHVMPHYPVLVGFLYERVFGFEEQSDEKTTLGGAVMSLISDRRQDYDMCRYSLTPCVRAHYSRDKATIVGPMVAFADAHC